MWKIEKGIPHCSECGYEPPLEGLSRTCPPVCPKCGVRHYESAVKDMAQDVDNLVERLQRTFKFCCHEDGTRKRKNSV